MTKAQIRRIPIQTWFLGLYDLFYIDLTNEDEIIMIFI